MNVKLAKINSQKGDTIIEVLIAMTIAASVLAITYSTMNRNLIISQESQERTQASKIAQGQLEALKGYNEGSNPLPCLKGNTPNNITSGFPSDTAVIVNTAPCTQDYYNFGIIRDSSDPKLYRVYVVWDKLKGTGNNQVIMVYRTAN